MREIGALYDGLCQTDSARYRSTIYPVHHLSLPHSHSTHGPGFCCSDRPDGVTFRPRRMHEMRTVAIDDPVAWASVSQSVCMSVSRRNFDAAV